MNKQEEQDLVMKYWASEEYAESLPILEKHAEENCPDALCSLGRMYIYGLGVEIDSKRGIEYLKASAIQEDSGAEYHLGLCYEEGNGVKKSSLKAFCWYMTATANDNILASYKVQDRLMSSNFLTRKFLYYYGLIWTIFFKPMPDEDDN